MKWSKSNVASRGVVRVMAERCATCIFRPGNLMSLQPGRVKDMVEGIGDVGCIPCHETMEREEQSICRGQFDAARTYPIRLAVGLGQIEWTK